MKCSKCSYESPENKTKFGKFLCEVCCHFAPERLDDFEDYIAEKVDKSVSEVYRKFFQTRGEKQKIGMIKQAAKGEHVSRPPFGYDWDFENKDLIPAQNFQEVEEIFEEFLQLDMNLRKLAQKHNLSVNGLKKILKNFTYIGKVKFDGQIHQGKHQAIVSSTLFNKVQDKLEKLSKKKNLFNK